ncbi:MAG: helix-turn-helix transcriptional regulator [Ruminococcaceae bacterium]|nr:helix-turn-helix transcriptional regulator [Oscillospiraceae bacterium]
MPLSKETIGRRILNARKRAHLTQAELSEKTGISEKYLSRIERGKQLPNIVIIARICEALCISADNMLLLNQGEVSNNSLHNEISDFSIGEQKQIVEIIKIIKKIKDQP